jgi:nucleoside-diphosphate-sugar epimerase
MSLRYFITGATGFVGGHLAEACVARNCPVTTIARARSDTSLLERLGAAIHRGDLTDGELVSRVVAEADVVVHCAAKVGDWGPVEEYRAVNVEGVRTLLEACRHRPIQRFVHLSSLGVYAARHHHGTDESEPLPARHIDGYTQTKVESEQLALEYHRRHGVPVVVLRPGFIYGPRDRIVLPQLVKVLRAGEFRFIGSGERLLNTIFVGNLVDAIFLAVEKPEAVGQVYNLTDGEGVSKRRFIGAIVKGLDLPPPKVRGVPLRLAQAAAWSLETLYRLAGARKAPPVTRAKVKFLGLNLDFSIAKARRELGYRPRTAFDDAIQQTVAWYRQNA